MFGSAAWALVRRVAFAAWTALLGVVFVAVVVGYFLLVLS